MQNSLKKNKMISGEKNIYEYKPMIIKIYKELIEFWKSVDKINLTIGDSEKQLDIYLKRNNGMSFVCMNENKIIGTILCGHDGRRGFIYHLAVSEDFRNKNIAANLISLSIEKLKSEDIQRCMIMVDNINQPAKKFWEHSGWNCRSDLILFSKDLI